MHHQVPPSLGISIGHTYACAAVVSDPASARVVVPPTPAMAAIFPEEDGSLRLVCGDESARWLRFQPRSSVVEHIKAVIGRLFEDVAVQQAYAGRHPAIKLIKHDGKLKFDMELDQTEKEGLDHKGCTVQTNKIVTPEVILRDIFANIKQRAEEAVGMGISGAVVTVPPHFMDAQRQAVKDAALSAGLRVHRIINEPTAAALAYGLDRMSNRTEFPVLVVNMGASTLNLTVLMIDEGIFEVRDTLSYDLGGDDIVEAMAEYAASQFEELHGIDIKPHPRPMARLKRMCERNMGLLSSTTSVTLEVDSLFDGIDFSLTISRARFEHLIESHVERFKEQVGKLLHQANFTPSMIEHVVLSGGACNIPKIQQALAQMFPKGQLHNSYKPEEVEAIGAAVQASVLCGPPATTWWEMAPAPFWNIPGAGLYHERECLYLLASKVDISIVETRAEVTVTQTFRNTLTNPLETVYVYPVEDGSAVFAFSAEVDGRLIRAEIKPKQEARETYEDAISSGHGAYLMEQLTGDLFQINVGNLQPGSVATIKMSYATNLALEGNQLRLSLPTFSCSASKYTPAGSSNVTDPSTVQATTEIKVHVNTASPLVSISSPTHDEQLLTEIEGVTGKASLTTTLAKEFVLKIEEANPRAPRVWLESAEDGSRAAVCTLYPDFPQTTLSTLPVELIFLVDRSGSMSGESIEQAKNALVLFLKSLPAENVYFNIVGFGSEYVSLFAESMAYNDESLIQAQKHVESIDADLGGTEILRPLAHIFRTSERPGVPRQIILLTDGEVSNTEEVIQFVRANSKNSRVFTLGIGAGASQRLVKGIAHAGRGSHEFVAHKERIEGKVMRQLRNALQSFMTDIQVNWGSLPVVVSSRSTEAIYQGQKLTLYALLDKHSPINGDEVVKFAANCTSGRIECSAKVVGQSQGRLLHTLAAKSIISELEEEAKAPNTPQTRVEDIREQILSLSLQHGVASSEASFVAVEEREDATEGTMVSAVPEMVSCVGGSAPIKMVKTMRTGSSVTDILLLDVTPLTLGFDVNNTGMMHPVILRNTTIPCRKRVVCQVLVPEDGNLAIGVYEGERPLVKDNNLLTEFTLDVSLLAKTTINLTMEFDLDANGILYVSATETNTGMSNKVVISNDKGRLSAREIDRMVQEADAHRAADEQLRQQIQQLHVLSSAGDTFRSTPFDTNLGATAAGLASVSAQIAQLERAQAELAEKQYMELIMLQKANGLWDLTPALQAIVGNVKELPHPSIEELETPVADAVMATAAAIAYLQCRVASRSEEWQLLALKARHQLAQLLTPVRSPSADDLIDGLTNAQSRIEEKGSSEQQRQASILSEAKAMIETMHRSIGALRDLLLQLPSAATITASSSSSSSSSSVRAMSSSRVPLIEEVD